MHSLKHLCVAMFNNVRAHTQLLVRALRKKQTKNNTVKHLSSAVEFAQVLRLRANP